MTYNDFVSNMFKRISKISSTKNNTRYKMETKSRYQVLAELEEKKRGYIIEKAQLEDSQVDLEREVKELKRKLEDKEEDMATFIKNKEVEKENFDILIASVDESLKRFTENIKKS